MRGRLETYLLLCVGALCVESPLPSIEYSNAKDLTALLNERVVQTIEHSNEIPGLKFEEFSTHKEEIAAAWSSLVQEGALQMIGTDKEMRPIVVAIQGIIEHVLALELQQEVKTLQGIIHTPMPATPLCTTGYISAELVDPSIENDEGRLYTVRARTTILRDYLFKGGDLFMAYPASGFFKRTPEQQAIYKQELANNPLHLVDCPLQCSEIPDELVGATYIFQDQAERSYVFGVKITQANDPRDTGTFGLWFGAIDHPSIQERLHAVGDYLTAHGFELNTLNSVGGFGLPVGDSIVGSN